MNKPISQHWVPRFYLKYFATPETRDTPSPMVYVHNRSDLSARRHRRAVAKVCVQNYLYTPDQVNGERDWSMEYMLGDIETKLGAIWSEIASGSTPLPDNESRGLLAVFVASMHLRNAAIRKLIGDTIAIADKLYGPGRTQSPVKPKGIHPDADHPDRFFVSTIRERLGDITSTFYAKRWIIGTRDDDSFITSDLPVVFFNPRNTRRAGPGTASTTAIFPLSPRRILLMDDRTSELSNAQVSLDDDAVSMFNKLLVTHSKRFVFAAHEGVLGLMTDK